jgi:carbamoyltransferase
MLVILGISAYYHDSAAALVVDGRIVAAAQEERFTRKKHDASFPANAIKYLLKETGIEPSEINYAGFYEKPFVKFERLLETYHAFAPKGLAGFLKAIPVWIKEKLYTKDNLAKELKKLGIDTQLLFPEHHLSHAASAFYPSPYEKAAILTIDGVGEWATTTIGTGDKSNITVLKELNFPHSLGLLYSAFTYYCGFRVNSDEYKLMGLAPYGNPKEAEHFIDLIKNNLVDSREDGSFLLNMKFFDFATGLRMTNDKKWEHLFGFPPRKPEDALSGDYVHMAYAIQHVTEEIILKLSVTAKKLTGLENLVLAGGTALNCVANGKIRKSGLFKNIWIQPAAGDAGGAIGAALAIWYIYLDNPRRILLPDAMSGAFLGVGFLEKEIQNLIVKTNAVAKKLSDNDLFVEVAKLLSENKIVGWFQGRMEFGPRALGNRSILANPQDTDMQKKLNLEIKFRESFRPFAPSVLEEDAVKYFDIDIPSPYMLQTVFISERFRLPLPDNYEDLPYIEKLYCNRSVFQAITHVDFSARVQTVSRKTNPKFYKLLLECKKLTGYGMLVNTSFNVRGEPIVCTPADAYRCFMNTGMDYLVLGNWIFPKSVQPEKNTELNCKS